MRSVAEEVVATKGMGQWDGGLIRGSPMFTKQSSSIISPRTSDADRKTRVIWTDVIVYATISSRWHTLAYSTSRRLVDRKFT